MKKLLIALVLLHLAVSPLWAQLTQKYLSWADGPVSFLMTPAELSQWKMITDDESAQHFIDLFWARRDQDPTSRVNEFRQQFDARVEAADQEFAEENLRGAMSDRGKTLILMGVPKEHARADIGEYLARIYRLESLPKASSADPEAHIQVRGISFNLNKNLADLWGYGREQIPENVQWPTKGDLINFAFFDTEGTGHFKLQLGIRKSAESIQVLRKMAEALLLHLEMTEIPTYGLIPGVPAASASELKLFAGASDSQAGVFRVFEAAGADDKPVYWLLYQLPDTMAEADSLIGRLKTGDGNTASFRVPVKAIVSGTTRIYEAMIPASVGGELETALLREGDILVQRSTPIAAVAAKEAWMSEVFAGGEVSKSSDAAAGDPFVFGGYHLLPRLSNTYASSEGLALFAVLRLGDAQAVPRPGTVRMRWVIDSKNAGTQPSQSVQFSPAGDGLWVWGTQLPLSSLSPGHEYLLKIRLQDSASGISRKSEIPLHIGD